MQERQENDARRLIPNRSSAHTVGSPQSVDIGVRNGYSVLRGISTAVMAAMLLSGCVESAQPLLTNAQPINGAQFELHIYEKLPEAKAPAFHTVSYTWKDGKYVRADGLSRDVRSLVVEPMGQNDVIIQGAGDNEKIFNYWLGRKLVEGVYLIFPVTESDSDPAVRDAACAKEQPEGICMIKTYDRLTQLARETASKPLRDPALGIILPR